MICISYTISKISFSYIMFITIISCRNYLQIVRSNYVYFGQINESVCLSVCHLGINFFQKFLRRNCNSFLIKVMSQWDFIMGRRLRLCHYYAVTQIQSTGKHQDLEQPVIFGEFLKGKLTYDEYTREYL